MQNRCGRAAENNVSAWHRKWRGPDGREEYDQSQLRRQLVCMDRAVMSAAIPVMSCLYQIATRILTVLLFLCIQGSTLCTCISIKNQKQWNTKNRRSLEIFRRICQDDYVVFIYFSFSLRLGYIVLEVQQGALQIWNSGGGALVGWSWSQKVFHSVTQLTLQAKVLRIWYVCMYVNQVNQQAALARSLPCQRKRSKIRKHRNPWI